MNMNSNIKCGTSINGGVVLTDMPIEMLKAMRDSGEVGLVRRILRFAERSNNQTGELLEPSTEEIMSDVSQSHDLSPEFIDMMMMIMPRLLKAKQSELTMRDLSDMSGMRVQEFYTLVNANIYKSPRALTRMMMLKRAEGLLANSEKPIGEIAEECCFITPNYFIALFFRTHQMTPAEYRTMFKA